MLPLVPYFYSLFKALVVDAAEPDLIATEMLAFPPKSSRNKNDNHLMIVNGWRIAIGKTTLI